MKYQAKKEKIKKIRKTGLLNELASLIIEKGYFLRFCNIVTIASNLL